MLVKTVLAALIAITAPAWAAPVFRFSLLAEPHNLDPQTTSSSSGNYLFHNIYRGLYKYTARKGLQPEGAASCTRAKLEIICKLRDLKWSDGSPVTAQQYVASFRRLIDPENKSTQSDVLFTLKNARAVWSGQMKPDALGVSAKDARTLVFQFAEEDPEFEYKLIHPALTPLPEGGFRAREHGSEMPVNGPYKITEWKRGSWVKLSPNKFYEGGSSQRPDAEALFIEEDATALRLYESGKLTFLRRLVAAEFPRFRKSPEFKQVPMARFDYVGFGPQLLEQPKLREAMSLSLEYNDYLTLFGALGPAGCPSLPASYMDRVTCIRFNPKQARALTEGTKMPANFEMQYSTMGGDDIRRAAEWFQGQWKKNLNLHVELKGQEQGVYLKGLRANPPAVFRKGVSLDRPTCLAALENFEKGHPENYIRLDDPKFGDLVAQLRRSPATERRRRCREAVDYLMSTHRLIPLGEMYFTILAKQSFTGWDLNELNQLDLSQLSPL